MNLLHDKMPATPSPMKWTRQRYDRGIELGVFTTEDRIELLDGIIFDHDQPPLGVVKGLHLLEPPKPMKWTRARYDECVAKGILTTEDKVELLDGEILEMSPQQTLHAVAVTLTQDKLNASFGAWHVIRVQLPFVLDDGSEPEPDIAVVVGGPRDYLVAHPSKAELIVEVAESSLTLDCGRKLAAYARNGVPEYWIVNLLDRQIEICRKPESTADGADYTEKQTIRSGESIAPLAQPDQTIAADDLLP